MFLNKPWNDLVNALSEASKFDRWAYIFWLLGPLILLIERTPADIWLSLLALSFVFRACIKKQIHWLQIGWVRLALFFWLICLISSVFSELPAYSFGEAAIWIRFPLFAMAVSFWLGRDRRLIWAMLISMGLGMAIMCLIGALEFVLLGPQNGRLSWPYGDLNPGNYLAKACMPVFLVLVSFAVSINNRYSFIAGVISLLSIISSVLTGERINLLMKLCAAMLAVFSLRPKISRLVIICLAMVVAATVTASLYPIVIDRFIISFLKDAPFAPSSPYFRAMAPGIIALFSEPILGVGPGNLRFVCASLIEGATEFDCHPHPHNFYIQIAGEVGLVGLTIGLVFIASLIKVCASAAIRRKDDVISRTMWIVPFAFFWPIAPAADFFGQWNNVFMWSAIAVALAGAQNNIVERKQDEA